MDVSKVVVMGTTKLIIAGSSPLRLFLIVSFPGSLGMRLDPIVWVAKLFCQHKQIWNGLSLY